MTIVHVVHQHDTPLYPYLALFLTSLENPIRITAPLSLKPQQSFRLVMAMEKILILDFRSKFHQGSKS